MIAKSDLAPDDDAGYFMVGELGIAIGTFTIHGTNL